MSSLEEREAALMRMDEELELRQQQVMEEAERAMKAQESRLSAVLGREREEKRYEKPTNTNLTRRKEEEEEEVDEDEGDNNQEDVDERFEDEKKGRNVTTKQQKSKKDNDSPKEMSLETVVRLQRAKLKALSEDLSKSRERLQQVTEANHSLKKKFAEMREEHAKGKKRLQTVESSRDKLKAENEQFRDRVSELEAQVASLSKELKESGKAVKQVETEGITKDVRLQRALEEVDKLKAKLRKSEAEKRSGVDSVEGEVKRLATENKRLEKQQQELLNAFRKQLKLIDVLKRQKIHLEAAKLLSFTEEDFSKTLGSQT